MLAENTRVQNWPRELLLHQKKKGEWRWRWGERQEKDGGRSCVPVPVGEGGGGYKCSWQESVLSLRVNFLPQYFLPSL